MEYVYAAMLLHAAGKKVTEEAVTKVLKAADVSVDATRVKALTAALEGVNIDEAIKTAIAAPMAAAPAGPAAHAGAPAKGEEKKKEEEKKPEVSEEEAAAGLGALFG